jgi:hypothetical protein
MGDGGAGGSYSSASYTFTRASGGNHGYVTITKV